MTIREHEKMFFAEMKTALGENDFVDDGVVDEGVWNEMPIKMLFLLKEAVGDPHKKDNRFSLVNFLKNGGYRERSDDKTWKNVQRWIREIIKKSDCYDEIKTKLSSNGKEINWIRCIAAVNVKKKTGKSVTDTNKLKKCFKKEYKEWLPRQLQFYNDVNIIICCGRGVMDCLQSVYEDAFERRFNHKEMKYYNHVVSGKTIRYYKVNDALYIIDYWHPAARIKTDVKSEVIADLVDVLINLS